MNMVKIIIGISIRMSFSGPTYMVEDDDTYSVSEKPPRSDKSPPRSDESPMSKTKKRKKRDNCSISWDYFETETTDKGDFDVCQICKKKNIDIRYIYDSSTGNMLGHLWSKHRIDKDHPEEQPLMDCQPIHILRSQAFCRLLNYIEAGFHIPCEPTVKKMIDKAYDWSCNQLFGMMNTDGGFINLTMNMWSSRTNQGYIGVTATWIDSNFELKEALLAIKLLPLPHTAEAIEDSFNQVIENWGLTRRVFCIMTNNGANVKKAIGLMNNVTQLSCSAHTLQLSVLKGLKPAMQLIKRAKNLILFFSQSPKQSERFADAQNKCRYSKIYQTINDVPTRWNSSYSAWTQLRELQKAIDYLVLMLPSEPE
ncbi:45323_t:CDS:2 [Gigaspora margarita]|uniref:45323_t:CDS:1 n=1 Tax=Gigaspora margarita TaxID=4874 RepID=A0ABN7W3E1_GIGMA|nr:45323_t:CDS:2 [Gigaspora margarita]